MELMDPVNPAGTASKPVVVTERDLVFYCLHCRGELVVDRAGIGLEVECPHCQRALVIPAEDETTPSQPAPARIEPPPASTPTAAPLEAIPEYDFSGHTPEQITQRLGELSHHLKENNSQDMEMSGHINRATIELHRLQLKLKKLQNRKAMIQAELAALRNAAPL